MIEMTLHAVTVRCESLTQALALLDQWARMGKIELPPEPAAVGKDVIDQAAAFWARKVEPEFVANLTDAFEKTAKAARSEASPKVSAPAKPSKRKAHTPLETRACGVCDAKFEAAKGARLVTCKDHRLKPGENLETARKKYLEAQFRAAEKTKSRTAKHAPDRASAKSLLGRAPIRPDEPTKPCSACGDKTRESELDAKGRCHDCQPIGAAK